MLTFSSIFLQVLLAVTPLEEQVDRLAASFISNFPFYITWPTEPPRYMFGVIDPSPLGEAGVDYLRGRNYQGKDYVVHTILSYTPDQLSRYQFILTGETDKKKLQKLFKAVKGKPVVTIGTADNFLQLGGIIHLTIEGKAVTFQVNEAAAKAAHLIIDPRLETYGQSM